jgi:6-phosphogluconate dehydrogenase
MWKFIDPIVCSWGENEVPLNTYSPDSNDIREKSKIVEAVPLTQTMAKEIGVVGLGKMGKGIALQLAQKGWLVHGYNRTLAVTQDLEKDGIYATQSLKQLAESLTSPRVLWVIVPAGKPVDEVIFGPSGVAQYLEKGDIIIDAGNSNYKDAAPRAEKLKKNGIHFMDVGTSGGPNGARYGACLMVGGDREIFEHLHPLFSTLSVPVGFQYFGKHGAGHFVKMVHNGIEYGMMQAIAEGFGVMKASDYKLNLVEVANLYNHGSVIESKLIGWMEQGLRTFGPELKEIDTKISHSGEGQWTIEAAKELKIPVPIIEGSLDFRIESEKKPSYVSKVVNVLRFMFGGHKNAVKKD